jgi:hypothetical protein
MKGSTRAAARSQEKRSRSWPAASRTGDCKWICTQKRHEDGDDTDEGVADSPSPSPPGSPRERGRFAGAADAARRWLRPVGWGVGATWGGVTVSAAAGSDGGGRCGGFEKEVAGGPGAGRGSADPGRDVVREGAGETIDVEHQVSDASESRAAQEPAGWRGDDTHRLAGVLHVLSRNSRQSCDPVAFAARRFRPDSRSSPLPSRDPRKLCSTGVATT